MTKKRKNEVTKMKWTKPYIWCQSWSESVNSVCNRGDTILHHSGLHTDFKSVQSRELGQFQIFWKRTTANQIVSTTSILSSNIWLFSYLLFIAWNSKTVFTCRWRGCWMMLQRFWKGTTAGQIVSTRILSSNGTILWWTNRRRSGQGTR